MSKLKEFQRIRSHLKIKLEVTDRKLENILSDSQLKNSTDVIELQIERLKLLDQLRYLRPKNFEDITYRQNISENFPLWASAHILDEIKLLFHGTTLANSERILASGKITSGKDRWTIHTSGDEAGEISVVTKDCLGVPLNGHADFVETYKEYEWYVPAGCLFVLKSDTKTYNQAQKRGRAPNVYLRKNPEQLYAIVTTPENLDRVKWWMQKNNFDPKKVFDFNLFKEKIEEDAIFYFLINSTKRSK